VKLHVFKIAVVALSTAFGLAIGQSQDQSSPPPAQGGSTPQSEAPRRVRISQKVSEALITKKVQPEYAQEAREKRIQGLVILKAEINKEGDVTDLTLLSGHPLLAPADAVKQWKYKPFLLNGQPIAVETQVSVSFVLQVK
jgi:TonB family protein